MNQEKYNQKLEYCVDKFNEYSQRARTRGGPHFNLQGWSAVFAEWYRFRIELLNQKALDSNIKIPKIHRDNDGRIILENLNDDVDVYHL